MERWRRKKSKETSIEEMEEVVESQLCSECIKHWREVDKESEKEIRKLVWFFEFENMDGFNDKVVYKKRIS